MAKLALNKSSLNKERKKLDTYRRYLPSLELKQKQLTASWRRAADEHARLAEALDAKQGALGDRIPMLASDQFDLSGMVRVDAVELGSENAVGVTLPVLRAVRVDIRPYSFLAEPHWVDEALTRLRDVIRLRIEVSVAQRRVERLRRALLEITQRVNLFREVLIPRAEQNIRRIQIHLGDAERSAVIRAKIAKRKSERGAAV